MNRIAKYAAIAAAILTFAPRPGAAQTLPLPAEAWTVMQALTQSCPDCEAKGFYACGTNDIGYGQRFAANLFAGSPRRGYLVTFVMTGKEYTDQIRREADHSRLARTLRERFAQARLLVIDENFGRTRILADPQIQVSIPEATHQCFRQQSQADSTRGECTSEECCDQTHGSPRVDAIWTDPESGETLRFRFGRTNGESSLLRQTEGRSQVYFCLNDSRGKLR